MASKISFAKDRHAIDTQRMLHLGKVHSYCNADCQNIVPLHCLLVAAEQLISVILRQAGADRNVLPLDLMLPDHRIDKCGKILRIGLGLNILKDKADVICAPVF